MDTAVGLQEGLSDPNANLDLGFDIGPHGRQRAMSRGISVRLGCCM